MRIPSDPIFDVALLLADVREARKSIPVKYQGSRSLSAATGIPVSTVQLHLRPSTRLQNMTVDHAMRWMMWLGSFDIRIYQKEINDQEDL